MTAELGTIERAYNDGYAAAQHEIDRLRAELEVSEAVNRAKTELLMDVSYMLSDENLNLTQRIINAGTAIIVRTGPPRSKQPTVDVKQLIGRQS